MEPPRITIGVLTVVVGPSSALTRRIRSGPKSILRDIRRGTARTTVTSRNFRLVTKSELVSFITGKLLLRGFNIRTRNVRPVIEGWPSMFKLTKNIKRLLRRNLGFLSLTQSSRDSRLL